MTAVVPVHWRPQRPLLGVRAPLLRLAGLCSTGGGGAANRMCYRRAALRKRWSCSCTWRSARVHRLPITRSSRARGSSRATIRRRASRAGRAWHARSAGQRAQGTSHEMISPLVGAMAGGPLTAPVASLAA